MSLFSVERPEWGVSEAAGVLECPKSSVSVMMAALAEEGLLRRTGARRYKLGWRVMEMSHILLETTRFRDEARRAMEGLVASFGETIHLAALERGQIIYLDKMQGTRAVQVAVTAVGRRFSAHASAVGKASLAWRPWEEVEGILHEEGMPAHTPNTITSPGEFREELARVRERGVSYDREEGLEELCCVAAPIRDHSGEVVAAMSFSVPAYRFERCLERYEVAIRAAARRVSEDIGYVEGHGVNVKGKSKEAAGAGR